MSNPSDRVLGTPPTNTSARSPADSTHASETGLAIQQRERETALHEVARLRKEASAEIERLLDFLDACDPYVTHELEEDDVSNPEGPDDDLEDGADDETSLGFLDWHPEPGSSWSRCRDREGSQDRICAGLREDLEEEHDGREQDSEDEGTATGDDEPSAGFDIGEPSLGWTVDGCVTGGTGQGRWDVQDDLEISVY